MPFRNPPVTDSAPICSYAHIVYTLTVIWGIEGQGGIQPQLDVGGDNPLSQGVATGRRDKAAT